MPITLRSLEHDRPLPERMAVDAGLLFRAINEKHVEHRLSLDFIKEAAAFAPPRLYASELICPEVIDAFYKELLRKRGDGDLIDKPLLVPSEVWDEVTQFAERLEAMVTTTRIEMCRPDPATRMRAWGLQKSNKLRTFDALHAATCLQRGLTDLVCFDSDLHAPLPDATIWTSHEQRGRWQKNLDLKARQAVEKEAAKGAAAPPA